LSGRNCEQSSKYFYSVLGPAGAGFNLGASSKKKWPGKRIFFDWAFG
jgi:hypothetical protein